MEGQRIGILGGTFDPPHNGHLVMAAAATDQLRLARTMFIVANDPWQKAGTRSITAPADRVAMVAAAIADAGADSPFEVSTIEIDRGGPTYTADTLNELSRRHPGREWWLIIGADVAAGLHTWERPDEVQRVARLAVVDRADAPAPVDALAGAGWVVERVVIPRLDISSTAIRSMLAAGRSPAGVVPGGAIRVIQERGLYPR